jgi:signal transduction histidine kinase
VTLMLDLPPDGLAILGDRKLLQQAVTEVLENAITFTGAAGSVTVSGRQIADHVILYVQDSGQGIAQEQLSTLHKPFQQLAREEMKGGMGIGLALVRGIIEAHGGRVTITSTGPGQGTTVTLLLPRSGDDESAPEHGTTAAAQREKYAP